MLKKKEKTEEVEQEKTKKKKAPKEKPVKEKKNRPKKEKSEQYIMRKNTGMKVLRCIFWIMLIFVFVRGVVTIFEPDTEDKAEQMIREFKEGYSEFTNQNTEVMAFAQNFAKEYLTYAAKGEEDYKKRLQPYVTSAFLNSDLISFSSTATATYTAAYRIEEYSASQADVYVLAEVEYKSRILEEDGQTYTEKTNKNQVTLRVPVYMSDGNYIVENLPLMVDDSVYLDKYAVQDYYGTPLDSDEVVAVETSVANFLKAYFEQDESVINYYLASSADKEKFAGLDGRFSFSAIEEIRCYQEPGSNIVCLVSFEIQDSENKATMLQKVNLSVQEAGGKYYIKSMDTRTGNLNIK